MVIADSVRVRREDWIKVIDSSGLCKVLITVTTCANDISVPAASSRISSPNRWSLANGRNGQVEVAWWSVEFAEDLVEWDGRHLPPEQDVPNPRVLRDA
jgi:hypothetical protein